MIEYNLGYNTGALWYVACTGTYRNRLQEPEGYYVTTLFNCFKRAPREKPSPPTCKIVVLGLQPGRTVRVRVRATVFARISALFHKHLCDIARISVEALIIKLGHPHHHRLFDTDTCG